MILQHGINLKEILINGKSFHYILFCLLNIFFSDEFWKYLFYSLYREGGSKIDLGFKDINNTLIKIDPSNRVVQARIEKNFHIWEINDSMPEILKHPNNIFKRNCYKVFLKETRDEIFQDPDIKKPFETLFQKNKSELVDFLSEHDNHRKSTKKLREKLKIRINKSNRETLRNYIINPKPGATPRKQEAALELEAALEQEAPRKQEAALEQEAPRKKEAALEQEAAVTESSLEKMFNTEFEQSRPLESMEEPERIEKLRKWALPDSITLKTLKTYTNGMPNYGTLHSKNEMKPTKLLEFMDEFMHEYYSSDTSSASSASPEPDTSSASPEPDIDTLDYDNLTPNETLFELLEKCIALTLEKIIKIDNRDFMDKRKEIRDTMIKINHEKAVEEERSRKQRENADAREREERELREIKDSIKRMERQEERINTEKKSRSAGITFPKFSKPKSRRDECYDECRHDPWENGCMSDCMGGDGGYY